MFIVSCCCVVVVMVVVVVVVGVCVCVCVFFLRAKTLRTGEKFVPGTVCDIACLCLCLTEVTYDFGIKWRVCVVDRGLGKGLEHRK